MADGFIQLAPDGTGKKRDSSELTVSSNTVERERIGFASPTLASGIGIVTNVNPSKTSYGMALRPTDQYIDSNRTPIILYADEVNSKSTEALFTFTKNVGGTETTGQTTYTITTGKTLRIQAIVFSITMNTTTGGQKKGSLRLRADPSAVSVNSPVYANLECASNAVAAVNEGTETSVNFSDGLEFPSGWQIGLSEISPGTASRTAVSFCVVGYEY